MKILAGGVLASFITLSQPVYALPQANVDAVAQHLIGVMDTSAQAEQISDIPRVRMTTCEVTVEGANGRFLYQEQALTRNLDQPYRQRFLRLSLGDDGETVESRTYTPENPETWIGLCEQPRVERIVGRDRITDGNCSVYLVPWHNLYIGHTQPGGCPADFRGAVKVTNTIVLHSAGMNTWDRGFNAQGEQVWGAESRPYQFRWQDS
ncbi:MAG: chromophore lyase CpcT/CpeT [Spirulinaceae cyanobacterium]